MQEGPGALLVDAGVGSRAAPELHSLTSPLPTLAAIAGAWCHCLVCQGGLSHPRAMLRTSRLHARWVLLFHASPCFACSHATPACVGLGYGSAAACWCCVLAVYHGAAPCGAPPAHPVTPPHKSSRCTCLLCCSTVQASLAPSAGYNGATAAYHIMLDGARRQSALSQHATTTKPCSGTACCCSVCTEPLGGAGRTVVRLLDHALQLDLQSRARNCMLPPCVRGAGAPPCSVFLHSQTCRMRNRCALSGPGHSPSMLCCSPAALRNATQCRSIKG